MAGQIPDPRTLNSWEDAFQHPLPVVRKLEQQLRKNIDDNREKLRSLVGASYRDLLGTAESIIEMDQQMETVETYLGDIGKKCNARTVEKMGANHAQMRKTLGARNEDKYKAMAQTKVLQRALSMVSRIIKTGEDALQASKLLVLSRLLYKSVSEDPHAPSILEELRRKLATQRKKLLAYIERTMIKPMMDKGLQARTLCAFALVTSSTPKEVLRYFLRARYEQLDSISKSPSETGMLQMLDLYSQTLLDTRNLFPRRFAESLAQLAKVPLLQDDQVQSVYELQLDIYGAWIAVDVRTFTPWVRHDQLTTSEVSEALASWAKQGEMCVLRGLQDILRNQYDAHTVVVTRQKVLSKFMLLSSKLRGDAPVKAIHHLREAFIKRLEELYVLAGEVTDITFDELSISDSSRQDSSRQSIWDLATSDLSLGQGALRFREAVVQSRHGRSQFISTETQKLDEWVKRVNNMLDLTDAMRMDKWDEGLDFDLDDVNDSDALLQMLSKEDPDRLHEKLRESVETALNHIMSQIASSSSTTKHAAMYVRMCREVHQRRRLLETRLRLAPNGPSFAVLHRNLAKSVSKDTISQYVQSANMRTPVATMLWDGSPPLPVQPSPMTFRFLKTLHQAMSDVGNDLWSVQAVFEMKRYILEALSTQLSDRDYTHGQQEPALANGHVEMVGDLEHDTQTMENGTIEAEDAKRDWLIQNLFDVHYLQCILRRPSHDISDFESLDGITQTPKQQLEFNDALDERLKKSAIDYWKRTHLLFGLLAIGGGVGA